MNECWNYFRYATLGDVDEIKAVIRSHNKWFSHINDEHFYKKIKKKECIFESGIVITFRVTIKNQYLGNYNVGPGNTILEQIAKNKSVKNKKFAEHIFIKFKNCSTGELYLAVNIKNEKAINFYERMGMIKITETKLDNSRETGFIFKSNKKENYN